MMRVAVVLTSIWPPIILTHWGRLDEDHSSNTAYGDDNYTQELQHPEWAPEGWTKLIRGHACYDPEKDLVVPAFKSPPDLDECPMMGAPERVRYLLAFFRRDMGQHREPQYSRGIRQRLHALALNQDWFGRYNISVGSQFRAPSIFHLLPRAAGDGWSSRVEDASLHGCIPVVIMDNVHPPFETLLPWDLFSLHIAEADVAKVPEILQGIRQEHRADLQMQLRSVWHQFWYNSTPVIQSAAHSVTWWNLHYQNMSRKDSSAPKSDALLTILQWLQTKMVPPGEH
ncbi:hypothetical protein WJX84_000412 [Apatococcus fuscideae]|uniref:Exostosin GT47 domain-containing protein n=1 Tax=Apatococcus fuscideae TaxID=2026836 RepID=A0AAW1SJ96_9CHLO